MCLRMGTAKLVEDKYNLAKSKALSPPVNRAPLSSLQQADWLTNRQTDEGRTDELHSTVILEQL